VHTISRHLSIFPFAHIAFSFYRFPIPTPIFLSVFPLTRVVLAVTPKELPLTGSNAIFKLPLVFAHFGHLNASLLGVHQPDTFKIRFFRDKYSFSMFFVIFGFAEIKRNLAIRLILNYLEGVSFDQLFYLDLIKLGDIVFNEV
jgi:hypothetical protein